MNVRTELLEALAEQRLSTRQVALALELEEADVVALRQALESKRARRRRWFGALAVSVVALLGVRTWAAGSCAQTLPMPLVTFCPDDPALAADVNGNFQALVNVLTTKLGSITGNTINTGAVTASSVSSATSVSTVSLTTTGASTLGGAVNVTGAVSATGPIHGGCPTTYPIGGGGVSMNDMGAYCIMTESPANMIRGLMSWMDTNDFCVSKGLRMCTATEVAAAVRQPTPRTRKYTFSTEGDYWVWVDQTATDSNAVGFGGCHVNVNIGKGSYQTGDINCAVDAYATNAVVEGLCCL